MNTSRHDRPPSVETLVADERIADLVSSIGRPVLTDHVRTVLDDIRGSGDARPSWPPVEELLNTVRHRVQAHNRQFPQRVINATGVLLHTNLGRAPWGRFMLDQLGERLSSYLTLEYNLDAGTRGKRGRTIERELAALAGAEDALVVNNNAAAVFLVLTTLAWNSEVVISRGELVQIGGGFRIPEILSRSGAVLREVGTTNKTSLDDYEKACGPQTALILKVHRSNFTQEGFVGEVHPRELGKLGKSRDIPVVWDLGSGAVGPGAVCEYSGEPTLKAAIASGVDLVTSSGDKLFGGPQAGMILGKADLVTRLRSDPYYRAVRPDKATLLPLEYTVAAHSAGRASTLIPLFQLLSVPVEELRTRANLIAKCAAANGWSASVIETDDTFGGGAAPGKTIKGVAITLTGRDTPDQIAEAARNNDPPIIGTIADDAFIISLRTVFANDDGTVEQFLQSVKPTE